MESSPARVTGGFPGFPRLKGMVSASGESWEEVRKRLTPRYLVAWRDIALCYAMGAAGFALLALAKSEWGHRGALWVVPIVACWGGFWLHALWLFGHEAVHDNLAPRRSLNDALANTFVWPLFAQTTERFRASHWLHHRNHGTAGDTEITYHQCLSQGFLISAVTGVFLLKGVLGLASKGRKQRQGAGLGPLGRAIALHALLVALFVLLGHPLLAAAWVGSVAAFFPAFAAVRQVLEHRAAEAGCEVDFNVEEHGPVNRLFSAGPASRYFGAAGFNRHLLHHWAPDISYTRFDDLESFLLQTPLASILEESRTTYPAAFRRMVQASATTRPAARWIRRPALGQVEVRP
jgi:fatty acid desaturase